MFLRIFILLVTLSVTATVKAVAPDNQQMANQATFGQGFSAERGAALWATESAKGRRCSDCHGADLHKPGRHVRTRKAIDPMALSANQTRFRDLAKMEKWFKRNCLWTWGRECSAGEKGDLLEYLYQQ